MSVSVGLEVGELQPAVDARLAAWSARGFAVRLWDRDPTVWFDPAPDEITDRLGWLCPGSGEGLASIESFVEGVRADEITDVVLLGMGGSSLAPEVFSSVFRDGDGLPLRVLDSTHPGAVSAVSDAVDPASTLFIVASKSGTTLETMSLFLHFWDLVSSAVDSPGEHFVAITDPGSDLERLGAERNFRAVFAAPPDVGGRFSALIDFGLVPAALTGVDVGRLLAGADEAAFACGPEVPVEENPALRLGAALGEFALAGRDKVIFETDAALASFPDWIEQLLAESLGKDGRGILPVADGVAPPAPDRLRFAIAVGSAPDVDGPSASMILDDVYDLGAAMYVLEMATAAAGAVLGVHPFDQPDVQLAKTLTNRAMADGVDGFDVSAWSLNDGTIDRDLAGLLSTVGPGGYVAIQAYLQPTRVAVQRLHAIAGEIAEATGAAVTVAYGPRFLHSTGQFHKGGPDTGVFLQIVDEPAPDVPVPTTRYTFGELITAQWIGDRAALRDRGRPVGTIGLEEPGTKNLPRLRETLRLALG